jgi:NAD(P)-dependent dehydrogenase (short-subunit alcohol dehydrogenase family)
MEPALWPAYRRGHSSKDAGSVQWLQISPLLMFAHGIARYGEPEEIAELIAFLRNPARSDSTWL